MLRQILTAFALCIASVLSVAPSAHAQAPAAQADDKRVMVMLRIGPDHFRAGSDYGGSYGSAVAQRMRMRIAARIAREHKLTIITNWPMQLIGVDCIIMSVPDGRSTETVAAELSQLPDVQWSQPLNTFEMQGGVATPKRSAYNDRLYPAQPSSVRWHLASLHRFATGRGVSIAIVDSRIDTTHPDLAGQSITVQDFVPGNRMLPERHGTGVAGIIAARPNNAMGIAGVAPAARIYGLRACWELTAGGRTMCDTLSLARALTVALERRVDVVNLSLTGPSDRLISTLIGLAMARGITVVAAVDAANPDASFPASVAGVIRVGDERLSARHGNVYIAPSLDIPTTAPEGKWSLVNGSSYATAHVSGLAALLKQLSGARRGHMSSLSAFGPLGAIDACAAIARLSALDPQACRSSH